MICEFINADVVHPRQRWHFVSRFVGERRQQPDQDSTRRGQTVEEELGSEGDGSGDM